MLWIIVGLLVFVGWGIVRVSSQIASLLAGVARMNRLLHDRLDSIEDHMGKPRSDRGRANDSPADRLGALYGGD